MFNFTRFSLVFLLTFSLGGLTLAHADTPQQFRQPISHVGTMPVRGMSMAEVEKHFGTPIKKSAAVGQPPISQWHYDGFVVYFEYKRVIHALAIDD